MYIPPAELKVKSERLISMYEGVFSTQVRELELGNIGLAGIITTIGLRLKAEIDLARSIGTDEANSAIREKILKILAIVREEAAVTSGA